MILTGTTKNCHINKESTTVAIIIVEENSVRVRNWRTVITRGGAKTDKISADWKKKPF